MRYKDRDALVASLREFADFLDTPAGLELPAVPSVTLSLYLPYYRHKSPYGEIDTKEKKAMVKKLVRLLKPVRKEYSSDSLKILKEFGTLRLRTEVRRDIVCKAVPTGNKIVHAAHYIPERIEEEVEWVCTDPLLKASE